MPNSQPIPFPDPACGSGSFFQEAQRFVGVSYNKQELARLAAPSASPESEFWTVLQRTISEWRRLSTALSILSTDFSLSRVKVADRSDAERLFGITKFDYVLTSPALDLCTVDTVWLSLPMKSVTVADRNDLKIQVSKDEERNRVLWWKEDGTAVRGKKATWCLKKQNVRLNGKNQKVWWRGSSVYVRIAPLPRGWIEGDNMVCSIQFSMPSVAGKGDNSWPLHKALGQAATKVVQDILTDIGISADIRQAKVVRCDLNRNVVLSEPFNKYKALYVALEQPHSKKKQHKDTGVTYTNKSQSSLFYDKIALMKKQGHPTEHLPPHLGRWEWQVKKAKNVRSKLGINTLQELLDSWDELGILYLIYKNGLFKHDVAALQVPRARRGQSVENPIQEQISILANWCRKHEVEFNPDRPKLEAMVRSGEVSAYGECIKFLPNMNAKHATDATRRMREAFWREMFQDPDFTRGYKEVREKLDGGYCWPGSKTSSWDD